jgi:hypothetical protein
MCSPFKSLNIPRGRPLILFSLRDKKLSLDNPVKALVGILARNSEKSVP